MEQGDALYKTANGDQYIQVGEENIVLPPTYQTIADDIDNFEVYDTDIFVIAYPKAGTTWTQEMVWMIMNDLDFENGKITLEKRFPFLEYKFMVDIRKENSDSEEHEFFDSVNYVSNIKAHPRFIKSHLPWSLLPKQIREGKRKPKIIYVYRNPKDVCVSYYYFAKIFLENIGELNDFGNVFMNGYCYWGPFWKNVLGYWKKRHEGNVLFITYEDMQKDLPAIIRNVTRFLEKEFDDTKISSLVEHLNFENMKKNDSVNYDELMKRRNKTGNFMRKGVAGNYKSEMSQEMINNFDKWIVENCKGTDFPLYLSK